MHGQRILVVGCCGSGKTTFSLRLGAVTGLPVVHLDKLYWKPGWVESTREEFYPVLERELSKDAWIMDGNYGGTLAKRLTYCDQVVYFDFPRLVCMWGILRRVIGSLGRTRADMGDGCPERLDWRFIQYTWRFKKKVNPKIKETIDLGGKPVLVLRSHRQTRRFLENIHRQD